MVGRSWSVPRAGVAAWSAVVVGLGGLVAATARGALPSPTSPPGARFALVGGLALVGVVAGAAALRTARRHDLCELGLLGAAFGAASVLFAAAGLTTPDVLVEAGRTSRAAGALAVPLAVLVAAPALVRRTRLARALARRWRCWALAGVATAVGLAALLVARPAAVPDLGPHRLATRALVAAAVGGLLVLSVRHLRLWSVGRRATALGVSLALVVAAAGATVPALAGTSPTVRSFAATLTVVALATAALLAVPACELPATVRETLGPIVDRDPLAGLEIGLSPVVQRFVAVLDRTDRITREHVVRMTDLVLAAGERARLPARRLRALGLAALLHDVGKLGTSEQILTKNGLLTDAELAEMRRHPAAGEALLRTRPELAEAAPFVRSHHERFDGGGYPDGLAGERIPPEARLIAVCDAFDAMRHTRHHRKGLGADGAVAVLQEHAGSQWDPVMVDVVVALARERGLLGGRIEYHLDRAPTVPEATTVCTDALPESVRDALELTPDR